jgi:UDP-N-acetylmuramyl pentapeptide phosphotransferase/UDP-N-acetylglucosamine-1-phosphate transferase
MAESSHEYEGEAQQTKTEKMLIEERQEIGRHLWRQRLIKSKSPQQVAKEEQEKRSFWPLMGGVVIGSLIAAFVLSNLFCAGEIKAFYSIWFILAIIGYCFLGSGE